MAIRFLCMFLYVGDVCYGMMGVMGVMGILSIGGKVFG